MFQRLAYLPLLLLAVGCGATNSGIPCQTGDNCPTGYVCNDQKTCVPKPAIDAAVVRPEATQHRDGSVVDSAIDSAPSDGPIDGGIHGDLGSADAPQDGGAADAACLSDSDCGDFTAGGLVCGPAHTCVACTAAAQCAGYGTSFVCDLTSGQCVSPAACPDPGSTLVVDAVNGSDLGNGSATCPLATLTSAEQIALTGGGVNTISMQPGDYTDSPTSTWREVFPILLASGVAVVGNPGPGSASINIVETIANGCQDASLAPSCALYEGTGSGSGPADISGVLISNATGRGLVLDGVATPTVTQVGVFNCGTSGLVVQGGAQVMVSQSVFGKNGVDGILVTGSSVFTGKGLYLGVFTDATGTHPIPNVNGFYIDSGKFVISASFFEFNTNDGLAVHAVAGGAAPVGGVSSSYFLANGSNGVEIDNSVVDLGTGPGGVANVFGGATAAFRNGKSGVCLHLGLSGTTAPLTIPAGGNAWNDCPTVITSFAIGSTDCQAADITEPSLCSSFPASCVQSSPCSIGP